MTLKHICIFLFAISVFPSTFYGQINEDFSDGDFTNNPTWTGAESLFVVENQVLRSNSPGESTYLLGTPNTDMNDTEWAFYINLDFPTSGVNYVDVYLVADNIDLNAVQNGYFLRFGGTPDEISLYKVSSGTVTIIIDGEDGVIGSSSNNSFDVKVQRTAAGEWSVVYDAGQTGSFVSGGNVTDNEITTTTTFGFRITQSAAASPINSHYFDNIVVGSIPVDNTPPEVVNAIALSATQLKITFSEPVDLASAENVNNYSVTGIFSAVTDAQLNSSDPTIVELTLDNPIPNGETVVLDVMNIEDLSGNAMTQQTVEIFYFTSDEAEFRNVVFNEIMADPSPVVGLPDAEFVELFNASDSKIFDLQNWKFVNSTTEKVLGHAVLQPGAYLILCDAADTALFAPFGTVLGISSFTAISNSGDSLTLLNPDGEIIDLVTFTDAWYNDPTKAQGGYTLELINPFTECSGRSNWSASNSSAGGTPGAQNSIFNDTPDTSPPMVSSFSVLSAQMVRVNFNEIMDETSLENGSYSWTNGISTTSSTPANELMSVDLLLDNPLATGEDYTLIINEVTDCAGNEIAPNTAVTILLGVQPEIYDLLITEIMADPTPTVGLPDGEYFELYNASNKVLDINGIKLDDTVFPESRILYPGDYLLCIDASFATAFLLYPDAYLLPDLGTIYFTNGGRDLTLYNAAGDFIDRANYNLSWYHDPGKSDGGYSLERMNLSEPCLGGDNWIASPDPKGGTPGTQNAAFTTVPDLSPPNLKTVFALDSIHLKVSFSEAIDSLSILTSDINITPEIGILSVNNVPPDYTDISIELTESLVNEVIYNLSISGIKDCIGNEMTNPQSLPFGLPEEGLVGDILINEILFNPNTGGSDYVEIVNVSNKIVGLQNWKLQNSDLTTKVISENPLVIFPGAYMVFTADPNNIAMEYPFGIPENFIQMDALPSFPNAEGAVIITNPSEEPIDRFDYKESYQFSLLTSFKGVALERTSFTRPTEDPGNWTSAAQSEGFGTPGKINSQYSPQGTATTEFELENEVFSPDNDGFQDLLNINYRFESPGYAATLKIFDSQGRLVKNLVNNELLASEGTLTWDGVNDNGTKARIGPHILLISIFDLDGNTQTIKIGFIVAGQLSN